MKAVVAHFSKDPGWLRMRPPLVTLPIEQQKKLIAELAAINFTMPGL